MVGGREEDFADVIKGMDFEMGVIILDYMTEPSQIREVLKSRELFLAMVGERELIKEESPRDKTSIAWKTQEGKHKLRHAEGL